MTFEREADARSEVEEFESEVQIIQAEESRPFPRGRGRAGQRLMEINPPKNFTAPTLTPVEQAAAADALRGALANGEFKYPELANHLLQNPHKLWIYGELQMMVSPEPNEASYDVTADLMEGLTTTTGQRKEYEYVTAHHETQQLFWEEIGGKFEQEDREFVINVLAQLDQRHANRVAALAMAWVDEHVGEDGFDLETEQQLMLNLMNWSATEQATMESEEGIWGALDWAQEQVEQKIISPVFNAINTVVAGPEAAARRRGLSVGQQVAYMAGLRPPTEAGEMGWWNLVSGAADAYVEIVGDPLAWVAGLGLGTKSAKTIAVANKLTRMGRAKAAVRSLLPKPFAGIGAKTTGGRIARVTYSLRAKTTDELLDIAVNNGIADDAMNLIKEGNIPKFQRQYPAWADISGEAVRSIQEAVQSPEEFIEILKADALNEVLRGGMELADLTSAAKRSETAMREAAGEVTTIDNNILDMAMQGLTKLRDSSRVVSNNLRRLLRGEDIPVEVEKLEAESMFAWWKDRSKPTPGLYRGLELDEAPVVGANIDIAGNASRKFDEAKRFATDRNQVFGENQWVVRFDDSTPAAINPNNTNVPLVMGNFVIENVDEGAKIVDVRYVDNGAQSTTSTFDELIMDQNIPKDLRLQAAKDRLRLNVKNNQAEHVFLLSEVPQKSKRIFSWDKALELKGTGRVKTGIRRTVARITPGRIPEELHLFDTKKGISEIRRIGEHFGLQQDTIDNLVGEFGALERGARQDWVWDSFFRTIGRETGVPAFEHQLVQFYRGAGVRNYSGSGVDMLDDGSHIPILSKQLTDTVPIPVQELTQIFRRARSIGERGKIAQAFRMTGRGLGKTAEKRAKLAHKIKRQLADSGVDVEDIPEEQIYDMAFSMVSQNPNMDGRGYVAGKMLPKAGSFFNGVHNYFTKAMLVFRPIQWMWRVALLEEPVRAHMFNLPSLYQNPLAYMAKAREQHYLWNARKWAEANMSWGQDVTSTLLRGGPDEIVARLDEFGLVDEIFGSVADIPASVTDIRRGVSQYIHDALYSRTRITKLDPVRRVPHAVKSRARKLEVADKKLKKLGLPDGFDFAEAAEEIATGFMSKYLSESVGASHRKLYQWRKGMAPEEAYTHGQVWGAKLFEIVDDPLGRMALQRRASILRGETPDITGRHVVSSSRWELMAPDLRRKYSEIDNDIALAERYMDDMLSKEIDHLFKPFFNEYDADGMAQILDEFADSRQIVGAIGNELVEWDLRAANLGAGTRQVGDTTEVLRRSDIEIPGELPAPSFDGRFMAEDPPGYAKRMSNWVLQTFGEKASQNLNRRPAWLHEYNRWLKHYEKLDMPVEHAQRLAQDHANKMVNHVFFHMDEAPYYVARLNKFLPFFGATYEVMGAWSYKMPVAIGGSWPAGVGEFARKFDRIIDGMINIGLLDQEVDEDGNRTITLNLVPPSSDEISNNELGAMLQGAGFAAISTLDQAVSTLFALHDGIGLEDGLEFRKQQGYRLAAGHPLNPFDYGVLSFVQADLGLNPLANLAVTTLAGLIPGAGAPSRETIQEGETLADVADRFDVDVNELVRYNREIFTDLEDFGSSELYNGLLDGTIDPTTLELPAGSLSLPGSSIYDVIQDAFMPFGEINNPLEFGATFVPSGLRWVWAGIALQNQPTDEFWKDSELGGPFGGMLPPINQAQAASQLNEAFMYLQAHDLVNGKGPLDRILEKEEELERLTKAGNEEEANALRAEIDLDTQAFLNRAQKVAAESLFLRGLTGNLLPTTPGHVRKEEERIRDFWDTRAYADSIVAGEGEARLKNFKTIEEVEEYKELLAAWLNDPEGDRARAVFRQNNPQLMAYLTPKTFYKDGPPPSISSYEEYQRQIESGEREPSPLHVTMWRARSATIQADYYNNYIATFGNDPLEAAANALQNREQWQELNDQRNTSYQVLEMWDEMNGSVYDNWRKDNYEDTDQWAEDMILDKLFTVRDNLSILFELEDSMDIELDLDNIANANGAIRGVIATISEAIRDYQDTTDEVGQRNAYEEAIHQYFKQVYIPYSQEISALYDQLPEVADSERQSLIYEQIKLTKNQYANSQVYLEGNTTTPFPNPLEFSWQGKSEEEQRVKLQQWITRPVEWMDLDQAQRIVEEAPEMAQYLPQTLGDFDIYRDFTLAKIQVDEMFEADEITRTQKRKAIDNLEAQLKEHLRAVGRGGEIEIMDMTPFEKLELSGMLPENLARLPINNSGGILSDAVRYYKQVLEIQEESPGTTNGRQIVAPLYNVVEHAFFTDPTMRETIQDLGINLQDEDDLNKFMPWLFFGHTGER